MLIGTSAAAQPAKDLAAIRAAALDYIEGWYTGDAARMERAVHPRTRKTRVDASSWVDFMHLARWNGRWVIINILWENAPR